MLKNDDNAKNIQDVQKVSTTKTVFLAVSYADDFQLCFLSIPFIVRNVCRFQ